MHEDDQLLAVNKPPGMLTMPSRTDSRRSLHDMVLDHIRSNSDEAMRVRPVNQLDREVSGVVLLAKSKRIESALESLFRSGRVQRTYAAIVEGTFDEGPGATGTVQSKPEAPRGRQKKAKNDGTQHRRPAVTHYRVAAQEGGVALVQLRPETHRRDQLVDHMRQIGRPILGDRREGKGKPSAPRLMLHLEQLAFDHPRTKKLTRILAPRPAEFERLTGGPTDEPANDRPRRGREPSTRSTRDTKPGKDDRSKPPAETPTSWQPVADWYAEYQGSSRSDHFEQIINPGALDLIGDVRDKRVLDVACGEGAFASLLAERGAAVVGIDASEALIEQARNRGIPRALFAAGDASRLEDAGERFAGPFDAATCIMALMNIADLDATLGGVAARLRQGAPFTAVILHPAFRAPRRTSWGWSEDASGDPTQFRRVDGYLSEAEVPITMNPGGVSSGASPVRTLTFHRPLSRYVSSLRRAGFVVDAVEEWASSRTSQPGPRAAAENRARAEIPLFMGIRALRFERTSG